MSEFRKKPVVIEAVQWTGENKTEIQSFCPVIQDGAPFKTPALFIDTAEGVMRADVGDWIIRGVKGEFYPCKPDIFAATYEPADAALSE